MKTKSTLRAALLALALFTICFTFAAVAQDPVPAISTPPPAVVVVPEVAPVATATPAPSGDAVSNFIQGQATSHPWIIAALAWLGIASRLIRPTFDYLHRVVKETPTTKDDALLDKIESSTVLKWILKVTTWTTGINILHPDKR